MCINSEYKKLINLVTQSNTKGYTITEHDIGNEEIYAVNRDNGILILSGEATVYVPSDVEVKTMLDGRIRLYSDTGITIVGTYTGCETFHTATLSVWHRKLVDASDLLR